MESASAPTPPPPARLISPLGQFDDLTVRESSLFFPVFVLSLIIPLLQLIIIKFVIVAAVDNTSGVN